MTGRLARTVIILAAALLVTCQMFFTGVEAQRRTNRRRPPASKQKPVRDYSIFRHDHHRTDRSGKDLPCTSCHAINSLEAPDVVAAANHPTIKGFPYHDSCLECHRLTRPQFFRGSSPVVCGVCHTRSSPRLTAKEIFPFPKPENVRTHELVGYFSHGSREHRNATRHCSACHLKDQRTSIAIGATGGEKDYVPAVGTFKTLLSGHASCFANCHWDKDEPTKDQCAGCHLTPEAFGTKKRNLLSPFTVELFKDWPRDWPRRLSLKFNHESENHREDKNPELVCTKCHSQIRQAEPLEIPNVKITACADSGCHFERTSRTSIRKEMFAEDEDIAEARNNDPSSRSGQNTCVGCHTKAIGISPPPCSHYLLFQDKYFSPTDYPKSAKQLSERCQK